VSKKNPKALALIRPPDQTEEQSIAHAAVNPAINAAVVVDTYQTNIMGDGVELDSLVDKLRANMENCAAGDLAGLEAMLIGQATALQTIFVSLAKRAHHQELQRHYEAFLGLALKAQAQSRATIQAVADLKFPRHATFVKQANIANGPQQVNNGAPATPGPNARARAEEAGFLPNELLEDQRHGGTQLDTGTATAATRGHSEVEAVEAVQRPTDSRRENHLL
jgi:hypothetical protein